MTVRQSLHFSTILGNYLEGSSGRAEVEIFTDDESVELTFELIQENYARNASKLGFKLSEIWENHRDSSIPTDFVEAIQRELGALYFGTKDFIEAHPNLFVGDIEELPSGVRFGFGAFDLEDDWEGKIYIDDYLSVVLFIILQGIPGVNWRQIEPGLPLFGSDSALLEPGESVGYGLSF